jgi:hypothetical protein
MSAGELTLAFNQGIGVVVTGGGGKYFTEDIPQHPGTAVEPDELQLLAGHFQRRVLIYIPPERR